MLQRVRRSPFAKQLQTASVLAFIGLLTFYPSPTKAQEKKAQLSPRKKRVRRDQAYVRHLLKRGNSDTKVENVLKLTSQFTSFNPSGDFHAYALSLIAKEKTSTKQPKQTQQPSVAPQTTTATVVSDSSSVPSSANVLAPSNPVGINSVKISQESSRDSVQDASPASTPDNIQAAVSNPSPATVVGGGVFLPTASAPSNGGVSGRATSVGTGSSVGISSNSSVPVATAG